MILVGLTGGIGSGKTTVGKFFEALKVPVFYSDVEAKEIMLQPKLRDQIIDLLGDRAYNSDGKPNKEFLSSIIFKNGKLNDRINNLIHPSVYQAFSDWCDQQDSEYVIQESALIFESGFEKEFDIIITVSAPLNIRMERALKEGTITEKDFMERVTIQMSSKEKAERSDFVIENIKLSDTEAAVKEAHDAILKWEV